MCHEEVPMAHRDKVMKFMLRPVLLSVTLKVAKVSVQLCIIGRGQRAEVRGQGPD